MTVGHPICNLVDFLEVVVLRVGYLGCQRQCS